MKMNHLGMEVLFIPQVCLASMCATLGICSEAQVSRALDRLQSKSVIQATPRQLAHFKAKGCLGPTTTRLNLLSHNTIVRLAQALAIPANIIQELHAADPGMPAVGDTSRAGQAAAQAAGVTSPRAAAAAAGNAAAAATRVDGPQPVAAGTAPAIPATLPVQLPLVVLTEAELHVNR